MKQKILQYMLICVMTGVMLTGCGGDEEKKESAGTTEETTLTDNSEQNDHTDQTTEADLPNKSEEATTKEDVTTTESVTTTEKKEETTTSKKGNSTPKEETTSEEESTTVNKEPETMVHTHSYTSKVTKTATCTAKGVKTYTCSCGDSYIEEVEKTEHTESDWVVVTEATCSSNGLKHKICTVCDVETASEIITSNGSHNYYWDGNSVTRTQKCSGCSYIGITEYNYNGAWGYYDDNAAATLWNYVNTARNKAITNLEDDWGNAIAVINVPKLTLSNDLVTKAKMRATEVATDFSHGTYSSECLAWGQGSPEEAMDAWIGSYTHMRAITDSDYIYGGLACFYYDSDNSGVNLTPIWVLEMSRK